MSVMFQPETRRAAITLPSGMRRWAWAAALAASLGALGIFIAMMSSSMRAVMAIGGSCGDDPAYITVPPCPEGIVGPIMIAGFGGLLAAGLSGLAAWRLRLPQVGLLGWPALFGVLGWNFIDYASPVSVDGMVGEFNTSWMFCGVLFEAMAVLPLVLVYLVVRMRRRLRAAERSSIMRVQAGTAGITAQ